VPKFGVPFWVAPLKVLVLKLPRIAPQTAKIKFYKPCLRPLKYIEYLINFFIGEAVKVDCCCSFAAVS